MIPVIIVSHKRADNVLTTKAISGAIICVPESQADEYKAHNPESELLIHPDTVIGLSPKRQWIIDKVGDCFQVDDDVLCLKRVYIDKGDRDHNLILSPDEAYGLIQDEYEIAKQMGVKLFGFSRKSNPTFFHGQSPIVHNKYICGGGLGIIADSKLFFPDYPFFVGEDYWISAINAYYHRFSYIDERFAMQYTKTEKAKGGCADYRTTQKRKETYIFLKKNFGDAIVPQKSNIGKKMVNKWEKTLHIPF
jgi:hypothetical protein